MSAFLGSYFPIIIGVIISLYAQYKVQSAFKRYSAVHSSSSMPAHMVARQVLDAGGLHDVTIQRTPGSMTDHYDPRTKVIKLSETVYDSTSLSALGVAVHEVGHAIQDDQGYAPLRIRSALVPVATFSSSISWILILAGVMLSAVGLIQVGIWAFAAVVLFQLVTLPVEFNASDRALAALEGGGYLTRDEIPQTKKVLSAAAFTYVAGALVSILQLLRLVMLFGRRE